MATFYTVTIQAILLYGAESWVLTRENLRKLNSFHLCAVQYMTGKHIRKKGDDSWEYPRHKDLLTECGLEEINQYINRRRTTLRHYLMTNKRELLREANQTRTPAPNALEILWWNQ